MAKSAAKARRVTGASRLGPDVPDNGSVKHVRLVLTDQAPTEHEIRWYAAHRGELVTQFGGQWIAIAGETIVGTGSALPDALAAARGRGYRRPFVVRVPRSASESLHL